MNVTTEKPSETLKMFTFKPEPLTTDKDKMETVIATSLVAAIQKNPKMNTWIIHSITK